MNPSSTGKDKSTTAQKKDRKNLPTFDDLPEFKGMKGCAWEVWGNDDQLGTVNLLTDEVVKKAAVEEFVYVLHGYIFGNAHMTESRCLIIGRESVYHLIGECISTDSTDVILITVQLLGL